jgi:hypothetical protein
MLLRTEADDPSTLDLYRQLCPEAHRLYGTYYYKKTV